MLDQRLIFVVLLLTTLVLTLPTAGQGQGQGLCDPALEPVPGELGYLQRGDRCEGRHVRRVSVTALTIAGLTQSRLSQLPPAVVLRWTPPDRVPVRLRARPLNSQIDYRMDTVREAGQTNFRWPSGLLRQLGLGPRDFGVSAWTEMRIEGRLERVYLPLRLAGEAREEPAEAGSPTLDLLPGAELQELYVTIERLTSGSGEGEKLRIGEALDYGYYPAGTATPIPLPELTRPGFYRIELAAVVLGGSLDRRVLFVFTGGGGSS